MPLGQLWPTGPIYSLYTAYIQPIYSLYTAYMQPIYSLYTVQRLHATSMVQRLHGAPAPAPPLMMMMSRTKTQGPVASCERQSAETLDRTGQVKNTVKGTRTRSSERVAYSSGNSGGKSQWCVPSGGVPIPCDYRLYDTGTDTDYKSPPPVPARTNGWHWGRETA